MDQGPRDRQVATPASEAEWVDLARRESRRKLERRVRLAQSKGRLRRRAGPRQLGMQSTADESGASPARASEPSSECGTASPGDPADSLLPQHGEPIDVPVTLSLRFSPEQYARYEAILEKLRKRGERAPREELLLAGLEALLVEAGSDTTATASPRDVASAHASKHDAGSVSPRDGVSVSERGVETPSPRKDGAVYPRNPKAGCQIPVYQIVVQQCGECGRAQVQTSRGAKAIEPAAVEAMRCDARVLRAGDRNRATIPPSVRREVLARDGHRCSVPGCGSARFLEVHHVVPRSEGGTNRPDNLVTLCSACHQLTHASARARTAREAADGAGADTGNGAGRGSRPTPASRGPARRNGRTGPKPRPG